MKHELLDQALAINFPATGYIQTVFIVCTFYQLVSVAQQSMVRA